MDAPYITETTREKPIPAHVRGLSWPISKKYSVAFNSYGSIDICNAQAYGIAGRYHIKDAKALGVALLAAVAAYEKEAPPVALEPTDWALDRAIERAEQAAAAAEKALVACEAAVANAWARPAVVAAPPPAPPAAPPPVPMVQAFPAGDGQRGVVSILRAALPRGVVPRVGDRLRLGPTYEGLRYSVRITDVATLFADGGKSPSHFNLYFNLGLATATNFPVERGWLAQLLPAEGTDECPRTKSPTPSSGPST